MKIARQSNLFINEKFFKSEEFYDIPIMGEAHVQVENKYTSPGDYHLGELIRNFKAQGTQSVNLRAIDNALSSEGILRGDYLTVDLLCKPRNNDVAAIKLGERIYIRKIFYDPQYVRLQSSNASVAPLIIDPKTPGFEILGKVIAVIREL
jgi:SOS-response transcriptional repressor LexA